VYLDDPPVASGAKVVLSDTDHHCGVCGDASFVWRNFLRGNNPIFMDPLDHDPTHEAARLAMGDTLRLANRINLAELEPRPELASTRYVLAKPGSEYLIYQPGSGTFSVNLAPGRYAAAWFNPGRHISLPRFVIATNGTTTFTPPFQGPAVLYLRTNHP
jgi:hypothetical protein